MYPYYLNQNKVMKKKLNILSWLSIFLISIGIQAQDAKPLIQSKLNGTVVDGITNEPIIGASINIKGTTHGVSTDLDGKFYFQTGQKFPYTLIVTYIGYKNKEVAKAFDEANALPEPTEDELKTLMTHELGMSNCSIFVTFLFSPASLPSLSWTSRN